MDMPPSKGNHKQILRTKDLNSPSETYTCVCIAMYHTEYKYNIIYIENIKGIRK